LRGIARPKNSKYILARWIAPIRREDPLIELKPAFEFARALPRGTRWVLKASGYEAKHLRWSRDFTLGQSRVFDGGVTPAALVCSKGGIVSVIGGTMPGTPLFVDDLEWALETPSQLAVQTVVCLNIDLALSATQTSSLAGGADLLTKFAFWGTKISLVRCDSALVRAMLKAAAVVSPHITVFGLRAPDVVMPTVDTQLITFDHGALDVTTAITAELNVISNGPLDLDAESCSLPHTHGHALKRLSVRGTVAAAALVRFSNLEILDCHVEHVGEANGVMTLRRLKKLTIHCRPSDSSIASLYALLRAMERRNWPLLKTFELKCVSASLGVGSPKRTCMDVIDVFVRVREAARLLEARGVSVSIQF